MPSSHYKPDPAEKARLIIKNQENLIIYPRALDIVWGVDNRYWNVPSERDSKDAAELLQVSWLEVTGSVKLNELTAGKKYKLTFNLELKPGAFGWNKSPVYFMVKPGDQAYKWKRYDLSKLGNMNPELTFTVPELTDNKMLKFGMFEVWRGGWKGGLVIQYVTINLIQQYVSISLNQG